MAQRPKTPAPARPSTPPPPKAPVATAPQAVPVAAPSSPPVLTQDKIARLAYEKWCQRGRPHGSDLHDWVEAEKELRSQMTERPKK